MGLVLLTGHTVRRGGESRQKLSQELEGRPHISQTLALTKEADQKL